MQVPTTQVRCTKIKPGALLFSNGDITLRRAFRKWAPLALVVTRLGLGKITDLFIGKLSKYMILLEKCVFLSI